MTRRSLIRRGLLILGIEPAAVIGCASPHGARETSRRTGVDFNLPPDSRPLSTTETQTLVAFGEVLVEGRTLGPADRQHLLEHIEGQSTRSADYLSVYRTAVVALDRIAGRAFAALEISERIDLINRHRLTASLAIGEELSDEMRALRMRTVPDLVRGYYGSPAGWAAVGYGSFPGRCGDLTRYTRSEA